MKKHLSLSVALLCMLATSYAPANMVEYVEDAYAVQAPAELVNAAAQAAQTMGFDKNYEVVVPKKAGIQVNPWNRFIANGPNGATNNWFVLVNPDWFNTLPNDQQEFLLHRSFAQAQHGVTPFIIKVIPWLFVLLTWLLIFILFWLFGKTALAQQKPIVRGAIAFAIVLALNLALLNKAQIALINHYARKHDTAIHEAVIQKTGNRQAAIDALRSLDAGLKHELAQGELTFEPHKELFAYYALALEK